jgi:hypothetical protein
MILSKTATVQFNPAQKIHRAAVKAFMVRRAWVDSPLRFAEDPVYNHASVADQVQSKLLAYYLKKEKLLSTD